MQRVTPASAEELARTIEEAARTSKTITTVGNNSKRLMGGPILRPDVVISTTRLNRVLQYEARDLTISVEAGMPFADLQNLLAERGQMIALDPPFWDQSTIGGIVASNSSGPMRRGFGTARDLIIGMTFITVDGKIIKAGGMVVKNVAGLDMAKLMIGSFGTLAIMTSINFRVHSLPCEMHTFLLAFKALDRAIEKRNSIIRSPLQPISIDLVSPTAAARFGCRGYLLAVRASGSGAVLARYARELVGSMEISDDEDRAFWRQLREFPANFLDQQPEGVVVRISTTLQEISTVMRLIPAASISRAASGITYAYFTSWQEVQPLWTAALGHGWNVVVEFAPDEIRNEKELWPVLHSPAQAEGFAMMKKVKQMFDPENLLNRSRLYGRI